MKRSGSAIGLYTIGIMALFLAGFLLVIVFGANIYKDTADGQDANNNRRAIVSTLSSLSVTGDNGKVDVVTDDMYGVTLVSPDKDTGYARKVYIYEDKLVEEYSKTEKDLSPADAQVIGTTKLFDVEEVSDDVLRIGTDAGEVIVDIGEEGNI